MRRIMMTVGMAVAVAMLAAFAWAQTAKPAGETKLVNGFEDASIWSSENDSPFEAQTQYVTQGAKSLKVTYTNKPQWSNIYTAKPPVTDWTGFRYLNFDVYWDHKLPGTFGIWIRDKAMHKAEASLNIGPGWNTLTVDLDNLKKVAELDRANVVSMCLYKEVKEEAVCYLDNMYLSKEPPVAPVLPPVRMPDAELITNGGFETLQAPDELGSPFAWWIARRWEGPSFLGRGAVAVNSGASSAMLDGRGACKIGWYSPPIEVKSPTKLKLTFYAQGENLQKGLYGQIAGVCVTNIAEGSLPGAVVSLDAGTWPWKKFELVFDVPAKCPFVKVFIQAYGKGRLWVDDVSLTGVPLDAKTALAVADTGKKTPADPPLVTETPVVLAKKNAALAAVAALKTAVADAKARGVETLYDEIPLVLADLAFNVRWDMPQHIALREGYADYVFQRATESAAHLRFVMAGAAPDLKVPPHPDVAKLKLSGRYYRENGEPRILFSMQYHSSGELVRWFRPEDYAAGMSAVGASRYDVQQMPVWKAYEEDPDTHRVYDDGWCGHIIRDKYSAGGSGRCVISLDSPRMRQAIAESIGIYTQRIKARKASPLYVNMGFEYSYVNYDKFSGELFRQWLQRKYVGVDKLNEAWKTKLASFADVTMPSYDWRTPETNPAKYFDWGDFNLWRFTDYMVWARGEMRKSMPNALTTTGGGEPFGGSFWSQGIDEEALADAGVCDIWLSETGSRAIGVTSVMDLQRSLKDMPIVDPEYHARPNTCFLMFLHGCGLMDYWWWPNEVSEFYESSMRHSHLLSLPEVETVMKTALDVRRLPEAITPFSDAKPQFALLYPRATLIQKFPGAQGNKTPYTFEVETTYGAAVRLDAPVGFASSKRIAEGALKDVKILVIPGARYVGEQDVANVMEWVKAGGTLVITPTSLIADEFNRKRNYLKDIGIEITSEELPEFMAGEAKRGIDQSGELDFIQGPVAKTVIAKQPKRVLHPTGANLALTALWHAEGVIQTVKAAAEWTPMMVYAGTKDAALLERTLGKGKVYYMAGQLDLGSRKAFFDRLMTEAGFNRPIRALGAASTYPEGVESRTVEEGGAYLTYLHNETGQPQTVRLTSPAGKQFTEIHNLNTDTMLPSPVMTLAPYETRIMRISLK